MLPAFSVIVSSSSSSQGRCGKPKAPTNFEQSSADHAGRHSVHRVGDVRLLLCAVRRGVAEGIDYRGGRGLPDAGAQRRFIAQIEYRLIGRNERGAAGQQALDLPAHLPRPAQQQDDRQLAQVAPVRLFPDAVTGGES